MKKLLVGVLVLAFCVSLVGCAALTPVDGATAVAKYVEKNGEILVEEMEKAFATSSGMTCESDIRAEGLGFVISLKIQELDNVDDTTKKAMQDSFDGTEATFDGMLKDMQKDIPQLEYFEIVICEKDGDPLATVLAGNKE